MLSITAELNEKICCPWIYKEKGSFTVNLGFMVISIMNTSIMDSITIWHKIAMAAMTEEQKHILEEANESNVDFDVLLKRLSWSAYQHR